MKEILTLVQLRQEGDTAIASLGGFDLDYSGERIGKDGYRYTTTPLGAVSRLEHALDGFAGEQERYRQRLADAEWRLASHRSRQGGEFSFADELEGKRTQHAEVGKLLAADIDTGGDVKAIAA